LNIPNVNLPLYVLDDCICSVASPKSRVQTTMYWSKIRNFLCKKPPESDLFGISTTSI